MEKQRDWVGLTDDEIRACNDTTTSEGTPCILLFRDDLEDIGLEFARNVEAKLREKNAR